MLTDKLSNRQQIQPSPRVPSRPGRWILSVSWQEGSPAASCNPACVGAV